MKSVGDDSPTMAEPLNARTTESQIGIDQSTKAKMVKAMWAAS